VCDFFPMVGKQDVKDLLDRLVEFIGRLRGSTCFSKDEMDEVVKKLREAADELQRIVG